MVYFFCMKNRIERIKNYFIPSEANNHKPHFLGRNVLISIAFFALVVELVFLSPISFFSSRINYLASVLPGVLIAQTNENRAEDNLKKLTQNSILQKAAQLKADDMATKRYFAHTSPDGKEPWYWLSLAGYSYAYAGENLAVNFVDSSDVTNAWMKSPEHRKNIVNQHYTEIGIAVASGIYKGKNTLFVVQFFGSPSVTVKPQNTLALTTPQPLQQKPTQTQTPKQTPTSTQPPTQAPIQNTEKVLGSETQMQVVKLLTEPRVVANYVFIAIILFVLCVLILTVFIKIKIQHPPMIISALAVIVLVLGLLHFNTSLSKKVEIPRNSASVIGAF